MDNIGGTNKIWITYASFIEAMNVNKMTANPVLKSGKTWLGLFPGQYLSTVKIEPQKSDSGILYNISADIKIPFQNIGDDECWFLFGISGHGSVLKYQTFANEIFIVGSNRFPLLSTFEELHSSTPSSGFNGWHLTITGKQLFPQLKVIV